MGFIVLIIFQEGQIKISNGAKIRNGYNQVLHLTQGTNGIRPIHDMDRLQRNFFDHWIPYCKHLIFVALKFENFKTLTYHAYWRNFNLTVS